MERSYGSFQRALNLPDDANQIRSKHRSRTGCSRSRSTSARSARRSRDARSRSTADVAGSFVTRKTRHETRSRGSRCLVASTLSTLSTFSGASAWPENNAGLRPTRHRAGGSQSQRSSQHHAVVRRPLPAISAPAKAHRFAAGSLVRLAQHLFETSSAVTSSASATTRRQLPPIPMTWSMPRLASPPPQVRVRRAVAAVGWPAASANSRKPCCRRPPNTLPNLAAPRWIPNICCWRWPTATWSRPSGSVQDQGR